MRWVNTGVAPCYGGGYVTLTLKDDKGGIVSVHVDESFNVRELKPTEKGKAVGQEQTMRAVIAMAHQDPMGTFAPAVKPGTMNVFISVGKRDGTPVIALPLGEQDGHRRYKIGSIRVNK